MVKAALILNVRFIYNYGEHNQYHSFDETEHQRQTEARAEL